MPTDKSRPVLLTGSEGAIGRVVSPTLRAAGWRVREFDHKPDVEHDPDVEQNVQGDIADEGVLDRAAEGVGAIVHLAAYPNPADFMDVLLRPNVIGLYRLLEAARKNNVPKVILASSIQAVNGAPRDGTIDTDVALPDNHYGLTKVWAEAAGEMYARLHGISVLAVRIGWFLRTREDADKLGRIGAHKAYLSHNDAGRFFIRALEADWQGYHTVYALSRSPDDRPRFDPEPARRVIGYEAQDLFPAGSSW